MPAAEYWLILLFFASLGATAFWFVWNRWRRARLIDDLPSAKIRSAPQGYTELYARALIGAVPLISPLRGRPCVWYRFKIEQRTRGAKGRRGWRTLHSASSDLPFAITDGDDRCLVDPRGAEITCVDKRIWYGEQEWPVTTHSRSGTVFGLALSGGTYRYTEELLQEGRLYALGWFQTVSSARHSTGEQVRNVLRDWKSDPSGLAARFDADGDGRVDVQEWQQARAAALRQVLQLQVEQPADAPLHTLGAPADARYPYLLSDHEPHRLAQRYRRQAALSVAVFLTAFVLLFRLLGRGG